MTKKVSSLSMPVSSLRKGMLKRRGPKTGAFTILMLEVKRDEEEPAKEGEL